jgi:hypothetical protein
MWLKTALVMLKVFSNCVYCGLFLVQQSTLGQGFHINEVSISHTSPQSVGLLWTSDQFVAEITT